MLDSHDTSLEAVRQPPLREEIRSQLLRRIISGEFPIGAILNEAELAEGFATSRIPVREALQDLARDRWVDLRARRSARVHVPSLDEVNEEFEVRAILQAAAAKRAATISTPAQIENLKEIVTSGTKTAEKSNYTRAAELNVAFHLAVASIADNRLLSSMVSQIEQRIHWYFSHVASVRGSASWREHREIVAAIEGKDPSLAEDLMTRHSARTLSTYDLSHGMPEA